jgi:energy-coupling factor transport system substrate-specific component
VSWGLASFLILAAVLVAGFAWYELSRPPAQVVALVAALAALAIAGRIAFAAFPNVKPTTDIVIFAGYALGGAPGFAVGALAALVSNLWFGQGPWTPWQMAGWGLCGILGAALALGGRNVGRLGLAAICGFAGIAYGALLNFSLMATYGGDLSLERFGVLQARALPFDLAHAAGNVAFALIAGPAMVRMLIRFRERFEWRRGGRPGPASAPRSLGPALRGGGVAALLAAILLLGALLPARADASGVSRAAGWLASAQNGDGGFGAAADEDSGAEMTAWAMLGLEAAGDNPLDLSRGGRTPVDYLRAHLGELKSPGDLARTIVALVGAGVDPRQFGGANLVTQLLAKRRDNGSYEGWPGSTAFAVVALRAAGATSALEPSLEWLRKVQNEDGGWGDVPGSPSTADGTGAVMQALSPNSKASGRGLSFLRQEQRKGGGFPLGGNGAVNTQSTAWAIQGILATGGDPGSFKRGGTSAPGYLSHQQASDGHYRYSKSSDQTPVWVTGQVLVAAAGDYYPVPAPGREPTQSQSLQEAKSNGQIPGLKPGASPSGGVVPQPGTPTPPSASPSPSASAGAGAAPVPGIPPASQSPGQSTPGLPTETPPAEVPPTGVPGIPDEETLTPGAEPATTEESSEDDSDSSPVGAAVLGLLAGGLLFGAGLGARRLWMRWRYGL